MYIINAGDLKIKLNEQGQIIEINDTSNEYFASPIEKNSFIHIVREGEMEAPTKISYQASEKLLVFEFAGSGTVVDVFVEEKSKYATFEIQRITNDQVEAVLWGPYFTTITDSIGESIGVVHNEKFAIGLQALNIKTVGGWPVELDRLEGVQQSYSDNRSDKPDPDATQVSDNKFEYDVCAAWPTNVGSMLQAFARDRSKDARRPVWNLPLVDVAPIQGDDANIVGSSIALFGCAVDQVLETIEEIELGEGLPHPMIEGEWGKTSPAANQSYLITDFSETTISEAVRYTKMAGFKYVYHPEPFSTWGHFKLRPHSFPNGDEGLKSAVALAESEGVHVGIHTLSNFTTRNDEYVTPKPDERLQMAGTSKLVTELDADADSIEIDDPTPFREKLFRQTAQLGSEQIEYRSVSEGAPWKLLGVKRGANKTTIAAHEAGTSIGRLWDHGYDVFFPNIELQDEYCDRITELFTTTGLKQISFDGLEGCYATGHDGYGVNRFVKMCYDGWGEGVINDASIVVPNYLWHIFTRFNWGEPWGAATREGQLEWRLSNQRYFARNFIPPMLGWFLVRSASDQFEATSLDEIEWVLSKSAGFGAGFALFADMTVLKNNGNTETIFTAVREWERARRVDAFTPEQRNRLKEAKGDWHLESAGEDKWNLYSVDHSKPLVCNPAELQPGQPGGADWTYYNRNAAQPLRFTMRVIPSYGNEDASVERPSFNMGGVYMTFETEIFANQYLVCEGDGVGKVYDQNWNLLETVEASGDALMLQAGGQQFSFSCRFEGDPKPLVSVKLTTWGDREEVGS